MISLFLGFKDCLNLALFVAVAAGIGWWVYRCIKNGTSINLPALCLVNIAILILWSRIASLNPDEVEHLHCSWMVSQGMVPFTDFWQHHSPLLWVMLAPAFKIMPQTTLVFDISRLLGACVFVLIGVLGWSISRKVWGKDVRWQVYLLLWSSGLVLGEYFWLRPDIFNVVFLLAGVRVSLDIPGKRLFTSFAAGASFALAMAFTPKQFLLCLLPLVVIIGERHIQWRRKVICFGAGLLLGFAPLALYLINFNIVPEYVQWVLLFNQKTTVVSVFLPFANCVAGIWAVKLLIARHRTSPDIRLVALIAAIILSTISSFVGMGMLNSGYYLECWFVLISAAGSVLPLGEIGPKHWSKGGRASLTGIFLALLILPNIYLTRVHDNGYFSDDKKAVARLLDYSRGDRCVALLPLHPVFVRDATRLYALWQFRFVDKHKIVRDDATCEDIARTIISSSPAVVTCRYGKRDFILELYQKKLISASDYKDLVAFLKESYTETTIAGCSYYIRNDRLQTL
jgi:hypothetical protein